MELEHTCTHCGGGYHAAVNASTTLCGACDEFGEFAQLAQDVLDSNGGRGDTYAASEAMGYPVFGDDGEMTYHVYELGGSIPLLTLCGAHEALYRWDAVSVECGVAHDEAAANYTTQDTQGACATCNEWGSK